MHLEELLDESMGFGVMEDLRLRPFEMGSYTTVYRDPGIGRGVGFEQTAQAVFIDIAVPSTATDVGLAFELMRKVARICDADTSSSTTPSMRW